jgi:hypothetical protein
VGVEGNFLAEQPASAKTLKLEETSRSGGWKGLVWLGFGEQVKDCW